MTIDTSARTAQFRSACALWDNGEHTRAFRLFLLGAKSGDTSSQLNLGFFYDEGIGVGPNQAKALYWYRRAHRGGSTSAAVNIGIVLRRQRSLSQAIRWFERALARGDHDGALQLGKACLDLGDTRRAVKYFRKVVDSSTVSEDTRRKAQQHLRSLLKNSH